MRACILSVVEPKHMVMVSMYTDYFEKNNIAYDYIFIDRYHENFLNCSGNVYKILTSSNNSIAKIIAYCRFRNYAKKLLINNHYDFVVVWNEHTASLLCDILAKHYVNKYSVNIRDLFDPDDKLRRPSLLYPLLNKAIQTSFFTTVSSKKFIDYLEPSEKYIEVHSINSSILPDQVKHKTTIEKPLCIMYIGKIGYLEEIRKLVHVFKNDDRFIMKFIGVGSDKVLDIINEEKCNNAETIGMFNSGQTISYLKQADIIFNLYGDDKPCEKTALSNKLYYAVCLNVPILVYRNTYMYEVANSCGIAFPVDDYSQDNLPNALYDWYKELDFSKTGKKCDEFKRTAMQSHDKLEEKMNLFFDFKKRSI